MFRFKEIKEFSLARAVRCPTKSGTETRNYFLGTLNNCSVILNPPLATPATTIKPTILPSACNTIFVINYYLI